MVRVLEYPQWAAGLSDQLSSTRNVSDRIAFSKYVQRRFMCELRFKKAFLWEFF